MTKLGTERQKDKLRLSPVLRTSVIIFLLLMSAKILNFLKKILIGNLFGVSWVADAFFAASVLPYYLAIFFEGVLFLGFLPIFAQVRVEKGEKEANQFVSEILILVFLLTVGLTLLAWWGAPWAMGQLVPGFSPMKQALTRSLFRILSLVVIFISLTSFFKALNSYFGNCALAASVPLTDSAVMIAVTLLGWKIWGIYGAAWAAVAGAATALFFQAVFLFRRHLIWERIGTLRSPWLGRLLHLIVPMAVIWGFLQLPIVILNRFGSGMWEGTISALSISLTLTTVPMGLVSQTVLFAVFPSLAKEAHDTTSESVREIFFRTLRVSFLVLIPIGFLLTALAKPAAALFFEGGGISEEGTRRIANSLACFGWASFAFYADLFMSQSLIAVRKTLPAIFLSGSRALLTYLIGYVLSTYWDYQGLALSFSIALVLNLLVLFPLFFRMSPYTGQWKALFVYSAKLFLAASPATFALLAFVNRWPIEVWSDFSKGVLMLVLGGGFLAGMALYFLLLVCFRVGEVRTFFEGLKKKVPSETLVVGETNP